MNVLVDADGCARLVGLGTTSVPSIVPGTDVDRFFHGAAPESIDLPADKHWSYGCK